MGSGFFWHWVVVSAAVIVMFAYPVARILRRLGFSGWWALLALIPWLNIVALWVFAFVRWPIEPKAGDRS